MTTINLKEMYSNYYIRQWKKQGLPLITERPPTTTQELLDNFFMNKGNTKKHQKKAMAKTIREIKKRKTTLNWRDYIKEEYKWKYMF